MKLELPIYTYCSQCGGIINIEEKEGRKRPVCSSCGHVVYVNPIPAAALTVIDGNRVLLTLRNNEPKKGRWCLPGGFIEWGETPEEGGKRELFEETGITANSMELIGVYNSITGIRRHVIVLGYNVSAWSGEPEAGDDAGEVRWFDISDMPALAFTSHEQFLKETIRRRNR